MPLINVYLAEGKSEEYISLLSDGIHEALLETWQIPQDDRFQMFNEMKLSRFLIDKTQYLNVQGAERSDDLIVIHITTSPRTKEMKLALYKRLPEILQQKIALRAEDVFISIISNNKEDWTFGLGKAQLLED